MASRLKILEENAGLHFLVQVDTALSDGALVELCNAAGIRVLSLGSYYHENAPKEDTHCLVVNYSGLQDEALEKLVAALKRGF